jgi:hypothetical protein
MASTPEEGKGVLFTSDKRGNPKAPDYKGEVMIEGKIIKLSAWKRQSAYGELISLVHNTWKGGQAQQTYPREINHDDDNSVPF